MLISPPWDMGEAQSLGAPRTAPHPGLAPVATSVPDRGSQLLGRVGSFVSGVARPGHSQQRGHQSIGQGNSPSGSGAVEEAPPRLLHRRLRKA